MVPALSGEAPFNPISQIPAYFYTVSAPTWYAVVEFIDKLDPDVLFMLSPRMDVFYLYWLKNEFADKGYEKLYDRLKEAEQLFFFDKVFKMFEELGILLYLIIPASIPFSVIDIRCSNLGLNQYPLENALLQLSV